MRSAPSSQAGAASLAQWASDLRLGVRLAFGGGRTSRIGIVRLALGAIGMGLAVAVLLIAASVGPMVEAHDERQLAQQTDQGPRAGVDPLYLNPTPTGFRGKRIEGFYLRAAGPRAPLPPGVATLPRDGEIIVSAALAELLAEPESELLRPRFPQRIVGTIADEGAIDAHQLLFYAGDDSFDPARAQSVYDFGPDFGYWESPLPARLTLLLLVGFVVLLVPVFVFIATCARIAGPERDRRLAALRLVGADARQVRRITAAESLVSAVAGLVLGTALFLLFRSVVGNLRLFDLSAYPSDLSPPWTLVVLIMLVVPALGVVTALVALRRTIIEPLGVVRRGTPVRRRLWWRLVPVLLGTVLLISPLASFDYDPLASFDYDPSRLYVIAVGVVLLLIGVPALLPWALERVVGRIRGGEPALQLAIRRLQGDSGTAARVVGGLAVVLAGAIALQTLMWTQARRLDVYPVPGGDAYQESTLAMRADEEIAVAATEAVRAAPGVRVAHMTMNLYFAVEGTRFRGNLGVADCETVRAVALVERCADGDVFQHDVYGDNAGWLRAGQSVVLSDIYPMSWPPASATWTVPTAPLRLQPGSELGTLTGGLLVTPGALRGVALPRTDANIVMSLDINQADVLEHVRNAVAGHRWRVTVHSASWMRLSDDQEAFLAIRNGLFAGSVFILLLAGASLLVLALEHLRERRRPLAALAASGVPTGMLARSLLWQNAVPVLLALLIAVGCGIGLAALLFRLTDDPFAVDWRGVGVLSAAATLLVLLVTLSTLPTLRTSTRLTALRTE